MSTGRLQSTIKHYRSQLKQHEAQAERALTYAHARTLETIQPTLDKLYREIAAKRKAGEDVPLSYLYEQRRLETIKLLISQQIDNYSALARMTVQQLQHQGVTLGNQSAQALLQASVPASINWSFGLPSPAAIANMVGATQAGSPLADLFNGFGAEAADKAGQALITGVTLGYNPRQIAPLVQQALDVSRYRALTIARTEMLRTYRDAAIENYKANNDVVDKWVWLCAMDARSCASCIAMNGTEHDLSEDLDGHPNCRCAKVPKTKSWDNILGPLGIDTSGIPDTSINIQSGSDWFDEQDESTQRQILGNSKYEAWSNGDFTLDEIVGYSDDPDWGRSIYEKPLKALVK